MAILSEDMNVTMNVKLLIGLIIVMSIAFGLYYDIKTDISDAAAQGILLPTPPVNRTEFELKTQMYANQIEFLQKQVDQNKEDIDDIEKGD
jgi:hypothetical protein